MATLKHAKAAVVLAAMLLTTAGSAAMAAPATGGAQQAVGIIALRHAADGVQTRIILEGTAELPYTIYRPDERTILVDLPGVDAARLQDAYAVDSQGVDTVQVERLRTASGQSLARLRIRLKSQVEDRTVVEGKNLVLTLTASVATPVPASGPASAATEPVREPAGATLRSEAPAVKPETPASVAVSPLRPVAGPAAVPTTPASVISAVRTDVQNGTFRAFVTTDGRASFKHFVLPSPDRIVVDITGVTSKVDRNALEVKDANISRIRIGQFRTADPRVVRIVFDVARMEPYEIRQVGNNVVLAMGPAASADVAPPAGRAPATARADTPTVAPKSIPPSPIVVDEPSVPSTVAAKPRSESPKPASSAPARAPVTAPPAPSVQEPVRSPDVVPAATTPMRPISEVEPQNASGRPSGARPAPATTGQGRSSTRPTQAPPPAPVTPRTQTGDGYLTEGFVGKPINLELKNVDVRDILRFIHNRYGVNFIVDRSVPADVRIDVSLKEIPWNQALDAVFKSQGLGAVREEGGLVRVATLTAIAAEDTVQRQLQEAYFAKLPLVTKIYRLKYISPLPNTRFSGLGGASGGGGGLNANAEASSIKSGIVAFISNRLSTRGKIEFDVRSNSLVVTDLAQRLAVIEEIIRVLDRPEPQVEIEARIVIARRTFVRDLGVQLAAAATNPSTGGFVGFATQALAQNLPPAPVTPLPAPTSGTIFNLTTGTLGTFQISAFVTASERKGNLRTIASPRVTTQNNTTATITNGVQIPVQTVSNNTVTTTFVSASLELEITPQIIVEDGAVLLSVKADNNSVSDLRTIGGTPGIDTQSANAIVLVPDGGTTILGGINIDNESQIEDRTPGLSRIPIFGNLFKRRQTSRDTQEILFFITPRIFRPELVGLASESSLRTNDVTISPVLPAGSEGYSTLSSPTEPE